MLHPETLVPNHPSALSRIMWIEHLTAELQRIANARSTAEGTLSADLAANLLFSYDLRANNILLAMELDFAKNGPLSEDALEVLSNFSDCRNQSMFDDDALGNDRAFRRNAA